MATLCPASLDDNEVANSDPSLRKFNCATMNREALRARQTCWHRRAVIEPGAAWTEVPA
jgi:hypothetical protein